MNNLVFRPLEIEDVWAVGLFCKDYASENDPENLMGFDKDTAHKGLLASIENPDYFPIVCVSGTQPVGICVGIVHPQYFNWNYKMLQLILWYVSPDYRSRGLGQDFMKIMEKLAIKESCSALVVSTRVTMDPKKTGELLEMNGFDHVESIYQKELKC